MNTGVDPKEITTKWYEANLQLIQSLGLYSIKTLVTLNSGSIVVMLTFLGNAAAQTRFTLDLSSIKIAMYFFLAGISAAAIVVGLAYVDSFRMTPYDLNKGMDDRKALAAYVGFSVLSFFAFVLGVLSVIFGVQPT